MEEIYILDLNHLPVKVDLYLDTIVVEYFYRITNAHQVLEGDFHYIFEKFNDGNLKESPFIIKLKLWNIADLYRIRAF